MLGLCRLSSNPPDADSVHDADGWVCAGGRPGVCTAHARRHASLWPKAKYHHIQHPAARHLRMPGQACRGMVCHIPKYPVRLQYLHLRSMLPAAHCRKGIVLLQPFDQPLDSSFGGSGSLCRRANLCGHLSLHAAVLEICQSIAIRS